MVQVLRWGTGTHKCREAPSRSWRKVRVGLPMPMSVSSRARRLVVQVQLRVRRLPLLPFTATREDPQEDLPCLSDPISSRLRTTLEGLSIQRSLVNSYRGCKPSNTTLITNTPSTNNLVRAQVRWYRLRINSSALHHFHAWDRVRRCPLITRRQPLLFKLFKMEVQTPTRLISLPSRTPILIP
jgi:hypothetical protein